MSTSTLQIDIPCLSRDQTYYPSFQQASCNLLQESIREEEAHKKHGEVVFAHLQLDDEALVQVLQMLW